MTIDENIFEKIKETKKHIIYLEKKPLIKNQIGTIIKYKGKDLCMRTLLTDKLFELFFEPQDYQRVYARQQQR